MQILFFLLFIIIPQSILFSVDPTITIKIQPTVIGTNETALVQINVKNEALTEIPVLSIENGDFTVAFMSKGIIRSTASVNGNVTMQTTYNYTYQLMPKKTGVIKIPAFKGTTKQGTTIYSPSTSITVEPIDSVTIVRPSQRGIQNFFSVFEDSPGQAFLQWELSANETPINTPIIADLYLVTDNEAFLSRLNYIKMQTRPIFNGGVYYEVPVDKNLPIKSSPFQNRMFYGKIIYRYILYPLESKTIPLITPTLLNDNGAFSTYMKGDQVGVKAYNPSDKITYIGNNLDISVEVPTNQIYVDQEAELIINIEGSGNTDFFADPFHARAVSNLFISKPQTKITVHIESNSQNVRMRKQYHYTIIPKTAGTYTIPSIELNYSDINGIPRTVSSKSLTFEATSSKTTDSQTILSEPKSVFKKNISYSSGIWWIFSSLALGFVILSWAWLVSKKEQRLATDFNYARSYGAKQKSQNILQQAEKFYDNGQYKNAIQHLRTAIISFITDKFALNPSSSASEIIESLEKKNIVLPNQEIFLNIISELELYSFGITPDKEIVSKFIEETKSILGIIDTLS